MNVVGSMSNASWSFARASIPTFRHFLSFTCQRRASSSTTSKPTLCRVAAYSAPGLPNPTMAFIDSLFLLLLFLLLLFLGLWLFFVLLALLDDFGLGRWRGGRRGRHLRRRHHFFGLRQDHVDQHHLGIADRLPLRIDRDVADAHALVQHQFADVDLHVLGNIGWQTFDLDLAPDERDEAALLLDALGLALHRDRNRDANRGVTPTEVAHR